MTAVLGMRGTGSYGADENPGNYRDMILYLEPNTKARLTAITGRLKSEDTTAAKFTIFSKAIPDQRLTCSGVTAAAATDLTVDAGDQLKVRAGHVLYNPRTGEIMWVGTDPSSSGHVTVVRAQGTVSAADTADDDELLIVGTKHPEGTDTPSAISYTPDVAFNYTQIFKTPVSLTGTAMATEMRTGDPWKGASREGLEIHGMEMEKAFLFGDLKETTDSTSGQKVRTTRGLINSITVNTADFTTDGVSEDSLDDFFRDCFQYGSNEKACFLGIQALNIFARVAKKNAAIQVTPDTKTYGLDIQEWRTTFGRLMLIQHPLLSESPFFQSCGFVVDTRNLVYRPLRTRDTKYLPNQQNNGTDGRTDVYRTEAGMEFRHDKTHGFFQGALEYVAA